MSVTSKYCISMAGHFGFDGGAMFGVVPKTLWEKNRLRPISNRIRLRGKFAAGSRRRQNYSDRDRQRHQVECEIETIYAIRDGDPCSIRCMPPACRAERSIS